MRERKKCDARIESRGRRGRKTKRGSTNLSYRLINKTFGGAAADDGILVAAGIAEPVAATEAPTLLGSTSCVDVALRRANGDDTCR